MEVSLNKEFLIKEYNNAVRALNKANSELTNHILVAYTEKVFDAKTTAALNHILKELKVYPDDSKGYEIINNIISSKMSVLTEEERNKHLKKIEVERNNSEPGVRSEML